MGLLEQESFPYSERHHYYLVNVLRLSGHGGRYFHTKIMDQDTWKERAPLWVNLIRASTLVRISGRTRARQFCWGKGSSSTRDFTVIISKSDLGCGKGSTNVIFSTGGISKKIYRTVSFQIASSSYMSVLWFWSLICTLTYVKILTVFLWFIFKTFSPCLSPLEFMIRLAR